jgi:hypothetical protein
MEIELANGQRLIVTINLIKIKEGILFRAVRAHQALQL